MLYQVDNYADNYVDKYAHNYVDKYVDKYAGWDCPRLAAPAGCRSTPRIARLAAKFRPPAQGKPQETAIARLAAEIPAHTCGMPQGPPLRQAARAFRHNSGRLCGKPHDAAQPRKFRPTRAACRKGPAPHGSQRNFWPRAPGPGQKIRHQRPLVVTSFLAQRPGPGHPRAPAPGPGPGPKECAGMPRNAKECRGVPREGGGPGGRGAGADCGHAASGLRPSRMLFLRMYIPCRNPHMKKVSRHAAAAARFGTAPPRAMRNKKRGDVLSRKWLEPARKYGIVSLQPHELCVGMGTARILVHPSCMKKCIDAAMVGSQPD